MGGSFLSARTATTANERQEQPPKDFGCTDETDLSITLIQHKADACTSEYLRAHPHYEGSYVRVCRTRSHSLMTTLSQPVPRETLSQVPNIAILKYMLSYVHTAIHSHQKIIFNARACGWVRSLQHWPQCAHSTKPHPVIPHSFRPGNRLKRDHQPPASLDLWVHLQAADGMTSRQQQSRAHLNASECSGRSLAVVEGPPQLMNAMPASR
jgi:hypothetical protein